MSNPDDTVALLRERRRTTKWRAIGVLATSLSASGGVALNAATVARADADKLAITSTHAMDQAEWLRVANELKDEVNGMRRDIVDLKEKLAKVETKLDERTQRR